MAVVTRPVDVEREQGELLDILSRNLTNLDHARRFNWLYRLNPAGKAWTWFAYEKETGRTVGTVSVFPREMWMGEKIAMCGQVGDFAVESGHRSLGPAVLLQRATFAPVDEGRIAFCYDCPPHDRGMSTFSRLGMRPNTRMKRYVRLLRSDRVLAKLLNVGTAPAPLTKIANYYLRLRGSPKHLSGIEVSSLQGDFGEEVSQLDMRVGGGGFIRTRRLAEDLNWRYRQDSLQQYQILVARQGGQLLGYVVFSVAEEDGYLVDLFAVPGARPVLLDAAVQQARNMPIQGLHAHISGNNELTSVFEMCGFRYRDEAERVVAYAHPGSDVSKLLGSSNWSFQRMDLLA